MEILKVMIENDNNIIKYVEMIRKFDQSISISEIKRRIMDGDFVLIYDLDYYELIEDISQIEKELEIWNFLKQLEIEGAKISIYLNDRYQSLEFLKNWIITRNEIREFTQKYPD